MPTQEEILLTIMGNDQASGVLSNVASNAQSMAATVSQSMSQLNTGMMQVSSAADNLISGLSGGKSASDLIFGTSSKAETNKVLLNMMSETQEAADALYSTVDSVTDSSLVSMQNLIPALNAFKTATGATDDEIRNATQGIADFGAKVLAQTGSTDLAEQAMMDLSKGIKGACASLDQYGITEDALMRTGLWNGKEDDIEGYIAAVQELTGDTSELMKTNEGVDQLIGKAFSRAGKQIGNELLPQIKDLKIGLLDLNDATGGNLFAGLLVGAEALDGLSTVSYEFNNVLQGVTNITGIVGDIRKAWKGVEAAEDVVDGATDIAEIGAGIGEAAVGAEVAAAETATFSTAFAGFGAGLGAMLAPMLMVAAAVAIMIPVIAGIVAEILIFVKLLMEVMAALDFDSVDLSGAIEGLKQFGTAMWELTKAMAAITGTAILATITNVLTIFSGGLVGLITTLVNEIKQVIPVINSVTEAGTINEDVPAFFTNFADVMGNLNKAVESMAQVSWSVLIGNLLHLNGWLGNFQTSISAAIEDIKGAASKIQELGDLPAITDDSGINEKLGQTADTLGKVADAISSLSTVNDKVNNWNPFTNFMKALDSAKSDIEEASRKLQEFNVADMTAVDENGKTIGAKLTSVADALKPVAEAINSLSNIDSAVQTWNPMTNFQATLESAKEDIQAAADALNNFNLDDISNVDENGKSIGDKIATVANALKPVQIAIERLSEIDGLEYSSEGGIASTIEQAKADIEKAAAEISKLKDLPEIEEGTATKITRTADALKVVKTAIDVFVVNPIPEISDNGTADNISKAREIIQKVGEEVSKLKDLATVPDGLDKKITNITNSVVAVKTAVETFNITKIPVWSNVEIFQNLRDAVDRIKTLANILSNFNGMPAVPEGLSENIGKIINGVITVKSAIETFNNTEVPAWTNVEMWENLRAAVEKIKTIANILNGFNEMPDVSNVSTILTSVNNAVSSLRTVTTNLQTGIPVPDTEIVGQAIEAVKTIVSQLSGLSQTDLSAVQSMLTTINNTLNQMKTTLANASGGFYTAGVQIGTSIKNGLSAGVMGMGGILTTAVATAGSMAYGTAANVGRTIGTYITDGFKFKLKLADVMTTEMGYVKDAVDNGISAAVTAAQNGAADVVAAFKNGINQHSPGDIAMTMYDEMWYAIDFIKSESKHLAKAAYQAGKDVVSAFGSPSFEIASNMDTMDLSNNRIASLETSVSQAPPKVGGNITILNINSGAVQLDARNLTTKESKQIMINAIEGLDVVRNVDIREVA